MITILFSGGMYGTTLEYCLSSFSKEINNASLEISSNGSMHSFKKTDHLTSFDQKINLKKSNILTPIYPPIGHTGSISDSVYKWKEILKNYSSKTIFVIPADAHEIMYTDLAAYYKTQQFPYTYLDAMLTGNEKNWNTQYTSWKDMEKWEMREAISFYCDARKLGFQDIETTASQDWLIVTTDDILYDLAQTVKKIFKFVNFTFNNKDFDSFANEWRSKQQYIIDEYNLIEKIFTSVKNNNYIEWDPSLLSLYGEAIVQSKLRSLGIELACFGLNKFPDNSTDLKKYLLKN